MQRAPWGDLMPTIPSLSLRNGEPAPLREVPLLTLLEFRDAVLGGIQDGGRMAALFGEPLETDGVRLIAVLAHGTEGTLSVVSVVVGDAYPALTPDCPQAHWFEREVAEQWGVRPLGYPWLKRLRFHGSYRAGHEGWPHTEEGAVPPGVVDFFRVEGEEVHEVAVGPVHAGIIEPGHFRFQCHGENVLHLEISLGYQHRGVERALAGGPNKRTIHYMETLAGDTSVGHATASCEAVEALAGSRVSARAQVLRGVALELERLANHTGDMGALAGDVGYLPTAAYCGRIRGDFLNMTALICGNRFGRGLVRPGGVDFDIEDRHRTEIKTRLAAALRDVESAVDLLWNSASVQARFEGTGIVSAEIAEALGLVGVAARACGLERDVRADHPSGIFRMSHIPVSA